MPSSVALRARAQIAQGRYQEAQTLLTPVASAQPDSDAALELGLLELYLGRRADGIRRLRLLTGRLAPRTARDYFRLARAASALAGFQDAQAFKEANSFFRDANKLAPDDPDINAAWGELFLDKHNPADAMKSFQEALRVDDNHVGALDRRRAGERGDESSRRARGARAGAEGQPELGAGASAPGRTRARRPRA